MVDVKELLVNGCSREVAAPPEKRLLFVLREDLGLTGAKIGCGEGECGTCTVLVDGQVVRSCIVELGEVVGKEILTIEGLGQQDRLHPLQESFWNCSALQCGYCTPGMIMSAVGLLRETPMPTRDEIIRSMSGNVCRCGCYPRIVRAIQDAATILNAEREPGGAG